MDLKLLLILCLQACFVDPSQRKLQQQIDSLEERYDNDYVRLRGEVRDLWNYVGNNEQPCCANDTARNTRTGDPDIDLDTLESLAQRAENSLIATQNGLKSEKRFARDTFKALRTAISGLRDDTNFMIGDVVKDNIEIKESLLALVDKGADRCISETKRLKEELEQMQKSIKTLLLQWQGLALAGQVGPSLNNGDSLKARSCMDIARRNLPSGEYFVVTRANQPFKVFCHIDYKTGTGLTFISPETYYSIDINDLFNIYDTVTIVHKRKNGRQYKTEVGQISGLESRPISVQFNDNVGHNGIVNRNLGPYVYIGLTPASMKGSRTIQGYKANGLNVIFKNCDGNPNGHFAFLFNHKKISEQNTYHRNIDRNWVTVSSNSEEEFKLPDQFFSQFELHFGGCGALASTKDLHDVEGAAVGLGFVMLCGRPTEVPNASQTFPKHEKVGSVTVYTCHEGYKHVLGDLVRTCQINGLWSEQPPVCLPE